MGIRRRCTECRRSFIPSPRALATQRVCGPECRATRDRKQARKRRRDDLDAYREDELRRQQEARARRAAAPSPPPAPPGCHAPPSPPKSTDLQEEFVRILARLVEVSRATLRREGRRRAAPMRPIVAKAPPASRATFGLQVCDPTRDPGAILAACHAP